MNEIWIYDPGCIQSWKTWKSHGIPLFFSRPGKVMEIDSRFWKIHKKSWKLKGILSWNGIVLSFIQHFNTRIHFCNQIKFLVSSTSFCTGTGTLCVVLKGKTGGSSWPRYMSLSCYKACNRSLILKLWSWRSHWKVMEKILKFSGYTLMIYCPEWFPF